MNEEQRRSRFSAETERWMRELRQRTSVAGRRRVAARIGSTLAARGALGGAVIDIPGPRELRGLVLPIEDRVAVMTFYVASGVFVMLTVYDGTTDTAPAGKEVLRATAALTLAQNNEDRPSQIPVPPAGVGWRW